MELMNHSFGSDASMNNQFSNVIKLVVITGLVAILSTDVPCWAGAEGPTVPKTLPGMISQQEYKDGMEQKKLSIPNPDDALREKGWRPCASIGVGDGYSVTLQFRQAHPMVAEYHRRVMIFSSQGRRGKYDGALQLRMNFGGRTYIMIYRHLNAEGEVTHVSFWPRDESLSGTMQSIRLTNPAFEEPPIGFQKEYIGLVTGESYPLKFVSPLILPEAVAAKKMRKRIGSK